MITIAKARPHLLVHMVMSPAVVAPLLGWMSRAILLWVKATPTLRRRVALLAFAAASLAVAAGIWNLLNTVSGLWFTILSFVSAAGAIDGAVLQLWIARKTEHG